MVVEFVHSFPLPSYGERRYHFPQASFHKLLHMRGFQRISRLFLFCAYLIRLDCIVQTCHKFFFEISKD